MKKLAALGLVTVLVGGGFAWGVAYSRSYAFPYRLVEAARARLLPRPQARRAALVAGAASGGASLQSSGSFERIASLGYVGSTDLPVAGASGGVTVHDRNRAHPGLNLFTSSHADEALLVDMRGRPVHSWRLPRAEVSWDSPLASRRFTGWRSARALPDRSLLAIYDYLGLVKLDSSSRVEWIVREGCHHDFWIADDGAIWTLAHRETVIPELNAQVPVIEDRILVLDADGRERRSFSLTRLLMASSYAFLLPSISHYRTDVAIDLLHTNSIQVLDGSLESRSPLLRRGNLLLSVRNLSTVFIVDPDAGAVVWAWGPSNVTYQHSARLQPDGKLLLFDNGEGHSTVVELDPLERRVTWRYRGEPEAPLASRIYGAVERLANGDVLVTDSMQGRVLEVEPGGDVVWRYDSPFERDGKRSVLFEMRRYEQGYFEGL
jgi:hypothetical protein